MASHRTPIPILRNDGSDEFEEAELLHDLTTDEVEKADIQWEGPYTEMAAKYAQAGLNTSELPPSWGWTWRDKVLQEAQPEWRFFGIEYAGRMQGMVTVDTFPVPCENSVDKSARRKGLYVCYLSAAPWNLRQYLSKIGEQAEFKEIGTALLLVAVQISREHGYEGRIILHSLQGSERFYQKRGMIDLGSEKRHPRQLTRFEVSTEHAKRLLL